MHQTGRPGHRRRPPDLAGAMEHMLTEFSRISSRYLAGLVQREYGLAEPVHCRLIAPDRVLYEVRSPAGQAVLRLHETLLLGLPASPLVGFQYEWARFLKEADLPVSFPIPRRNGSLFGVLEAAEGARCFGLWSYAEGDTRLTKERTRLLGETLARLHMAADSFRSSSDALRFDLEALLHKPQERLGRFFARSRPDDIRFLNEVCGALSSRLQHGLTELPPWSSGPIWGMGQSLLRSSRDCWKNRTGLAGGPGPKRGTWRRLRAHRINMQRRVSATSPVVSR